MLVLSKSRVQTFEQCRRKYRYSYIDEIEVPKTEALERGIFIHKFMEKFYDKIDLEKLKVDPGSEIFAALKELKKEHPEYAESILDFEVRRVQQTPIENFKPLYKEIKIYDKSTGTVGIIDRVDFDSKKIVLIDYKTGRSCDDVRKYRFELSLYAYLFEKKTGKKVEQWGILFLKDGKLILEDVKEVWIRRSLRKIRDIRKQIDNETDWMRNITPLCDWCEYKEICFKGMPVQEFQG